MKFKYIPGMRPTPMLMFQNHPNKDVFENEKDVFKKGEFVNNFHHMWNIGAYLIYNDKLEVISYRISNPHNFIWLLRIINQELTIEFEENFIKDNQNFLVEVSEELITM